MLRLTTLFAALLAATFATSSLAQETDAEAEAPAETQFDLGEPVTDGPQPGQPYIREVFGDWSLRCLFSPDGPDPCQLYQLLLNEDDTAVSEISIVPLPEGGDAVAGVIVVVPLETQLTADLTLSIDGGQAQRYPYDFCNAAGCIARFGLAAEQVSQFKRGAEGNLSIVPAAATDQRVNLRMSLTGFTAGFDATQSQPE